MNVIHILMRDGRRVVYAEADVPLLLEQGRIAPDLYFWREGMEDWKPLSELVLADVSLAEIPISMPVDGQARKEDGSEGDEAREKRDWLLLLGRSVACLIDLAFVFGPVAACYFLTVRLSHSHAGLKTAGSLLFMQGLYLVALGIVQLVMSLAGLSIGKKIMGVRAVNEAIHEFDLRIILRLPTHGVCAVFPLVFICCHDFYLGALVYAAFDSVLAIYDGRCLHDYIANTFVVRRRRRFW